MKCPDLEFEMQVQLLRHCIMYIDRFSEGLIPRHPCLQLVSSCEQPLQRQVGRRLLVMEKTEQWTAERHQQSPSTREHDHFRRKYFTRFTNSLPHTAT